MFYPASMEEARNVHLKFSRRRDICAPDRMAGMLLISLSAG
jgi:hypothetical protein